MNNVFFFQTQQIPGRLISLTGERSEPDSSSIFNQLKEQKIFFSYFQEEISLTVKTG